MCSFLVIFTNFILFSRLCTNTSTFLLKTCHVFDLQCFRSFVSFVTVHFSFLYLAHSHYYFRIESFCFRPVQFLLNTYVFILLCARELFRLDEIFIWVSSCNNSNRNEFPHCTEKMQLFVCQSAFEFRFLCPVNIY